MTYESPHALATRLKLGREEFVQRLLTSLIVGGPYPKWNARNSVSAEGHDFLRRVHALGFADGFSPSTLTFVDEFELEARTGDEPSGWPDWAVLTGDWVWIIELKTEVGSHRADQVPYYAELARHHHPDARIDLTLLSPPLAAPFEPADASTRYHHLTWRPVVSLIEEIWGGSGRADQQAVVDGLIDVLNDLDSKPSESLERYRAADPQAGWSLEATEELGQLTAVDGDQRAVDHEFGSVDELTAARDALNARFASAPTGSPLRGVRAWRWRWESTGDALTDAGRTTGWELRLSRYGTDQWS